MIFDAVEYVFMPSAYKSQSTPPRNRIWLWCGLSATTFIAIAIIWLWYSYLYPQALILSSDVHKSQVYCVAFSGDGNFMATGGEDRTVKIWDLSATRKVQLEFVGHSKAIAAIAFSPDGRLVAAAGWDGTIRIWEIGTGREVLVLPANVRGDGAPYGALALAFSSDGRILATSGEDISIRIWDVANGKQLGMLKVHNRECRLAKSVCCLAFTAGNNGLFLRTNDGGVQLWSLTENKHLKTIEKGLIPQYHGFSLGLTPDGKTLVYNHSIDEKIKVWDVTKEQMRTSLKASSNFQDSWIRGMSIAPDGETVAGIPLFGGRIFFWNLRSGQLINSANFPTQPLAIAFSPDGKLLASTHFDGTVNLWDAAVLVGVR